MKKQHYCPLLKDYEPLNVEVIELCIEKGYAVSGSDLDNGGSLFSPTNWD